jgi:hypothetical protein
MLFYVGDRNEQSSDFELELELLLQVGKLKFLNRLTTSAARATLVKVTKAPKDNDRRPIVPSSFLAHRRDYVKNNQKKSSRLARMLTNTPFALVPLFFSTTS